MIKIGDKLLCKKDFNAYGHIKNKGEYYIITNIHKNRAYFNDDWYSLKKLDWYIWEHFDTPQKVRNNWYIWKWFYTPKEIRKMKLKQLMTR